MSNLSVPFVFWLFFTRVFFAIRQSLRDPRARALVYTTLLLILVGTLFYRTVEGWRWLDALYFTVITLTTVGYGDLAPQTDLAKIFTMFYILVGLGIIGSFIALIANSRHARRPFWPGLKRRLRQSSVNLE